jgi:hypothetical protein
MTCRGALVSGMMLLLATGATAASKRQPIEISVGPAISFEPGNVRITSMVQPDAANRTLLLEIDSGSHYSSSELPLEGENAARSHSTLLKNLPAGEYLVTATLRLETGVSRIVRQRFQVLGGRGDAR